MKYFFAALFLSLFGTLTVYAAPSIFQYSQGGTGTTTAPVSQLLYGGKTGYQSVATSTVTCSTGASCTAFSIVGSGGSTITVSGLGTSNFTSANISQWTNNSGYFTAYDAWAHPNAGDSATTSRLIINPGPTGSSTIVGNLSITGGATTSSATSTSLTVTSSSTLATLFGAGLGTCTGANKLLWSGGSFSCAVDQTSTVGQSWEIVAGLLAPTSTISLNVNVPASTSTILNYNSRNFLVGSSTNFSTGVGFDALDSLLNGGASGGANNTAVGYQALATATSTNNNTALGFQALFSNGNQSAGFGNNNTAVGSQASRVLNIGFQDTMVGASAGVKMTSASSNTIVGFNALNQSVTGGQNSAVGVLALSNLTNQNNIGFGYGAGQILTGGSGNIIIGTGADALANNSSNTLNIGNVLFGSGIYASATANGGTVANGKLAVGSTTPFSSFAIHANQGDTNRIIFAIGSTTATPATSTLFQIDNNGQASTTNLVISGLGNGVAQCLHISATGLVTGSGSDCASTAGFLSSYNPFTNPTLTSFATTSGMVINNASSTFVGNVIITGGATTTNATSTTLSLSGFFNLPNSTTQTPVNAGQFALDLTDDQLKVGDGANTAVFDQRRFFTFSYATSTWTGTTTAGFGTFPAAATIKSIQCYTGPLPGGSAGGGTLNVDISYGSPTVHLALFNASSTVGTVTFSANNTPSAGATSSVAIGTPASSPVQISCTETVTISGT